MSDAPFLPRRHDRSRRMRLVEDVLAWAAIGIAIGIALAAWWVLVYSADLDAGRCGIYAASLGVELLTLLIVGVGWILGLVLVLFEGSRPAGRTLLLVALAATAVVLGAWNLGPDALGRCG